MRIPIFICSLLVMAAACDQPEPGAMDNDSLSRKLFDVIRQNNFEKSVILMPDKGTYRKIIEESRGEQITEDAFDSLLAAANVNFENVRSKTNNWEDLKFQNAQSELIKQGHLQFANTVVKAAHGQEYYKFNFTSCKFNSKWFYMGDLKWIDRDEM